MLQAPSFVTMAGIVLLLVGILLIIAAFLSMTSSEASGQKVQRESKGVVLLGPIPIVWGYGRRGWLVAAIIAISLFLIFLMLF